VWPAADIPLVAVRRWVPVVQINPNPTDLDQVADYNLRGAAGKIMPMIFSALK
jgi:NAD-dependent deacetylase